jgi:kynurenine formamidase
MADTFVFIDLTKSLDESFSPYSHGCYSDPPLEWAAWSTVGREGFRVDRLSLGTQSGTHIDAPAHFLKDGVCLDALGPEHFMGRYLLLDVPFGAGPPRAYSGEDILFLRAPEKGRALLTPEEMGRLLALPPALWVAAGDVSVDDPEPFAFNRLVAGAGKFLAEDLDRRRAQDVPAEGEIFVFPLRLACASGSPCRVVVRARKTAAGKVHPPLD